MRGESKEEKKTEEKKKKERERGREGGRERDKLLFLMKELNYFCREVFAVLYLHNSFCVLIKESKGFYQGKLVRQDHLKTSWENTLSAELCFYLLRSCCWKKTVDKDIFLPSVCPHCYGRYRDWEKRERKSQSVHTKEWLLMFTCSCCVFPLCQRHNQIIISKTYCHKIKPLRP